MNPALPEHDSTATYLPWVFHTAPLYLLGMWAWGPR